MYLAWLLYILWGFSIFASFWGVLKVNGIHRALNYIPVIGLISYGVFSYVFVFNRGSSVAQLSEGAGLWSLWFNFWIPFSIFSIIAIIVSFIFLLLSLFKYKNHVKIMVDFVLLIQSVLCAYHVVLNMPDA